MKHHFAKNVSSLLLVQMLNYLSPFLLLPLYSRKLDAGDFSSLMFCVATSTFLQMVVLFGFNISAIKRLVSEENEENKSAIIVSTIFAQMLIWLFSTLIILAAFSLLDSFHKYLTLYLHFIPYSFCLSLNLVWLFQADDNLILFSKSMLFSRLVGAAATFIAVYYTANPFFVPWAFFAAYSVGLAYQIKSVVDRHSICLREMVSVKNMYAEVAISVPYFTSRIAGLIYNNCNNFLVAYVATATVFGYYAAVEKLYFAAIAMLYPVLNALYPMMLRNKSFEQYYKIAGVAFLGFTFGCVVLGVYADFWILLLYGESFTNSDVVHLLHWFSMALVINAATQLVGYPLFAIIDRIDVANKAVFVGAIAYIIAVSSFFVFQKFTPVTAIQSLIVAEFCVFMTRLVSFLSVRSKKV